MPVLTRRRLSLAVCASPWDLTNKVLYDLCRREPFHSDLGVVLAKVFLIGRSYAAAIERRREVQAGEENDSFYVRSVAPKIMRSKLDSWLEQARSVRMGTPEALRVMVKVHGDTTKLFSDISGMEKRSLASKYLHFHVPRLFYIYDSRAAKAIREFNRVVPRASRTDGRGDNEYRKFAEKCDSLSEFCSTRYGLKLAPRQLDNLFLQVNVR